MGRWLSCPRPENGGRRPLHAHDLMPLVTHNVKEFGDFTELEGIAFIGGPSCQQIK